MYSMTNHSPGPMSPVLISQDTGKRYPATKAGRAQLDADEGRIRLHNDQMESMIVLRGCLVVMRKAVENLKPFVRKTGKGRMLAAAIGLLYRATADMMSMADWETAHAKAQYGERYASLHEANGVLIEELQEGWDEGKALTTLSDDLTRAIRERKPEASREVFEAIKQRAILAACEYTQVAAVAQKAMDGMPYD